MRSNRITGVLAGVAVLGLVLTGCSNASVPEDSGSDSEPQHVTLWVYPVIADEATHKQIWDETIAEFEKDHSNITVDYEIFPWANRDDALQTAIAANKGPDLVYLIPDQLAAYEKSIEPMGDYMSDDQKSQLLDNVRESVTFNGKLMGAPILTTALPMVCNAKVFEDAGVTEYPVTWDDFLAMAPKFVAAGDYALHYPASSENSLNNTFYPLLWQAGGDVFDSDGNIAFDSAAGTAALTFLTDLNGMGALDPKPLVSNVPTEQAGLAQNKTACSWANSVGELEPFWGAENVKVLPPLKDKKSVTYGTVGSLSMLKTTKNKKAAGEFAEFATSKDIVVPYLKAAGYTSALKSTPELYGDQPLLSAVEKTVPLTTVGTITNSSRAIMGVIAPEIQAALLGDKSAADAIADAAKAAAPLIKH